MIIGTRGAVAARRRACTLAVAVASFVSSSACSNQAEATRPAVVTLRIGFGLAAGGGSQVGFGQFTSFFEREPLIAFGRDARPQPSLADRWETTDDGRRLRIHLKPGVRFHSGTPLSAALLVPTLRQSLAANLGRWFTDVEEIRATGNDEIEFRLRQRSTFVLEGLDVAVVDPGSGAGTGPFRPLPRPRSPDGEGPAQSSVEFERNTEYHGGTPSIDRVVVMPYPSVRAAWADMLRDEVDVLYEIGMDAEDSLSGSTRATVMKAQRPYVYSLILNAARPVLREPAVRRALNNAIDRRVVIAEGLNGHGAEANSPVSSLHWAFDPAAPRFVYDPVVFSPPLTLRGFFPDSSFERLALSLQKQWQAVGVTVQFELVSPAVFSERAASGDFDIALVDLISGPSLVRPAHFWGTGGRFNWGRYSSPAVDAALDALRSAPDDDAYRRAVSSYQSAIVNDPPAVFIAWSERLRAFSTRFEVREPGHEDVGPLRVWRPSPSPPGGGLR